MKLEAKCKICGRTLSLSVDDGYARIGDPFNLLPLAACDRCYDLKLRRDRLHAQFSRIATRLLLPSVPGLADRLAGALGVLCVHYARLIADYHYLPLPPDPRALPEKILREPARWREILSEYRAACRPTQLQTSNRKPETVSVPYADP